MTIQEAHEAITGAPETKAEKKIKGRKKQLPVPFHDDPKLELKRLVREHKAISRNAVRHILSVKDKKCRFTGEIIVCPLPESVKIDVAMTGKILAKCAADYKPRMVAELKKFQAYNDFLAHVYGFGEIACAYLMANIDIAKSEKVSNLIRYCGNACNDKGKAERRSGAPKVIGGTGTFNSDIKSKVYVAMASLWKNAQKKTAACPNGATSKYLQRWRDTIHTEHTLGRKGGFHKGRRKATDLFLEDLYIVMRAIAGLPVWCSWYASKRMYEHGGKPIAAPGVPTMLSVEEALARVGNVGAVPLTEPYVMPKGEEAPAEDSEEES